MSAFSNMSLIHFHLQNHNFTLEDAHHLIEVPFAKIYHPSHRHVDHQFSAIGQIITSAQLNLPVIKSSNGPRLESLFAGYYPDDMVPEDEASIRGRVEIAIDYPVVPL
jgi:hypothetical protein